jgi:hypothetical protein
MKVKHLNFEVELEGNGIVNFDAKEQKFLWGRESKDGNPNDFTSRNNNNMYAKKVFFRNEDGKLNYKIKISSDSLRNSIFKGDAIATTPSIMHQKTLLNSFIGSVMGLIRGYMFADEASETIKRKSPLTIGAAIQKNNAVSYMEFHARSGEKKTNNDSDKSDTSIFNRETIGDIIYRARGCVNLENLQFLSSDPIFDRYSFNSDDFEVLKMFLEKTLPNFNNELGYYTLKTSAIDVSEYGIKLTNEQNLFLIKELLKRILGINISRATGFANVKSLKIELVNNPIKNSENQVIEIKSIDDIDALDFEIEDFYVLADETEAKKQRAEIEEVMKAKAKKSSEDKKAKKESKKENN